MSDGITDCAREYEKDINEDDIQKLFFRIGNGDTSYIEREAHLVTALELGESDEWRVQAVYMTEAEFKAMPEFMGF